MIDSDISKEKMDQIIELATKKKPWTVIKLRPLLLDSRCQLCP